LKNVSLVTGFVGTSLQQNDFNKEIYKTKYTKP